VDVDINLYFPSYVIFAVATVIEVFRDKQL
jgi:hypothetical protein